MNTKIAVILATAMLCLVNYACANKHQDDIKDDTTEHDTEKHKHEGKSGPIQGDKLKPFLRFGLCNTSADCPQGWKCVQHQDGTKSCIMPSSDTSGNDEQDSVDPADQGGDEQKQITAPLPAGDDDSKNEKKKHSHKIGEHGNKEHERKEHKEN